MKKLTSLLIVVTMSVLLASCGGGNAASSGGGSSTSGGSYNSSCQSVANYIDSYEHRPYVIMRDFYGRTYKQYFSYSEVSVKYKQFELLHNTQTTEKCLVGKYLCGEYTYNNSDANEIDSDEVIIAKGSRHGILRSILNGAQSCQQLAQQIVEVKKGNMIYHFNISIAQEANPVRIIEDLGNNERTDYYVYDWQVGGLQKL